MYLPERDLVLYLLKHEYFTTYFEYIDLEHIKTNYRELHHLYVAVQRLHERFPNRDHNLDSLQAFFFTAYPDADRELYLGLFKTLLEAPLDPEVGVGILQQIKQRSEALKLSERAVQFATGAIDLEAMRDAVKFLTAEEETEEDTDEPLDLEGILDTAILKSGLRWRLNCLNKSLGSLRDGDFGFLFKRPETGGTAFCASEVGFMLPQAERPVIWINNEEADDKVKLRVFQAYFGVTLEQLRANPKKYSAAFKKEVGNKFKFFGLEYSNRRSIEALVKKYNPQLMVYDQIDKVQGFDNERDDLRLGSIYQWVRELCKKGHAAIGVTQADGSAENVKWLTMQHVANAKTSKQAEADWIIGMGAVHSEGNEYSRFLSLCKNKLLADVDSMPELRHGRFEVLIEPQIMQFKDIVNY